MELYTLVSDMISHELDDWLNSSIKFIGTRTLNKLRQVMKARDKARLCKFHKVKQYRGQTSVAKIFEKKRRKQRLGHCLI